MKTIPIINLVEMTHLVLIALWGGVVLTETVIELYPFKEKNLHNSANTFHYYIDIFVETPILFAVLLTGLFLALQVKLTALHYLKIFFALIAITMNFTCIAIVIKRKKLQDKNADENILLRYTRYIITTAVIGIPFALTAIYIGLTLGQQRIINLINGVGR